MKKLLVLPFLLLAFFVGAQSYIPLYGFAVASGTNTYTASVVPTPAFQNGLTIKVKFTNANTGASTINLNSLGAKSITTGDGAALSTGTISAGQVVVLIYDGTSFQLQSGGGGLGGPAWGSITGTLSSQSDLQSALNLKANLTSPSLTGNPTAPTQLAGDNSTKIATTAYVDALSLPAADATHDGYLAMADWSTFNGKQAALVSGTNIKTVNGTSVLGSGDLAITGGWALTGVTTLTGQATITTDVAKPILFNGTWTANANNQNIFELGGSLTSRSTAVDILEGGAVSSTLIANASNQQDLWGLHVRPTLVSGNASDRASALVVTPTFSGTFNTATGILSKAALPANYGGLKIINTSTGGAVFSMVALNSATIGTADQFYIERGNGANGAITIANSGSGAVALQTNNVTRHSMSGTGSHIFTKSAEAITNTLATFTQPVMTGGSPVAVLVTGGAHTTLAGGTEATDVNINLARTVNFSNNPITTQRAFRIQAPTYSHVSGSNTITTAATLSISNAPQTTGGFTTITNPYALLVEAGNVGLFGKTVYDATITAGGTTGNQTINKPSGTVNIAAAGTAITVTNSFCLTTSIVLVVIRTNDTTAYIKNVVPGAGSFVVNLGAAATSEISIGFIVHN